MREKERQRGRERESKGGEYVKERVARLLPVPCVCFLCCFRLFFTHRHTRLRSADTGRNSLRLSAEEKAPQATAGQRFGLVLLLS